MYRYAILLMLSVVFIFNCGSSSNPENIAKSYLQAIKDQNWDKAKEYGTENTAALLQVMKGFMSMSSQKDLESLKNWKIEIKKMEVNGDSAICYYKNSEGNEEKMNMIKIKGDWKVDMKKEMPGLDTGTPNENNTENNNTSDSTIN